MSRRRRKADDLNRLAADLGPEDGGDPREFHAKPWDARKKASRKGQQLCQQVKDALTMALPACADPLVQGLSVLAVEPAPHTGRLLVILRGEEGSSHPEVLQSLVRATGYLRTEAAAAISRRHAPELIFQVLTAE